MRLILQRAILFYTSICALALLHTPLFAQTDSSDDATMVEYDTAATDPFAGNTGTSLILDYFHTEGASWSDRFDYEVVIYDSLLTASLNSRGSEDFHHVIYLRKKILTENDLRILRGVLHQAHLKQVRAGVPRPTFSGSGQEVLIVHDGEQHLFGGRAFSVIGTPESDPTKEPFFGMTIDGDFDTVAEEMMKLFPRFDTVIKTCLRGHKPPAVIGGKPRSAYAKETWVNKRMLDIFDLGDEPTATEIRTNDGLGNIIPIYTGDSAVVMDAMEKLPQVDATKQPFYFMFVTYALEEALDALPDATPQYLLSFLTLHPKDLIHYFATEPSLHFGQLDDWAVLVSATLPHSSKDAYDLNEKSIEENLNKSVENGTPAEKSVRDLFIDRLRDIKQNAEEAMK
jgi:hypothetical protein